MTTVFIRGHKVCARRRVSSSPRRAVLSSENVLRVEFSVRLLEDQNTVPANNVTDADCSRQPSAYNFESVCSL